jgi:KDO2-lipid IV(A) lauroyltransferase
MFGKFTYLIAGNLRRTGERNLLLAFPEKSAEERNQLLRGCFESLGRELGLFAQLSTRKRDRLRKLFDIEGLEHLESAQSLGNGVILITAHLGAWELTSFSLSVIGHPIAFLVRRIDNPRVELYVDKARTRFGNQTVDKLAAARSMVKTLRSGELLGLLPDLNTLDDEAIFVDFFGVPASTNFVVAKLSLRTNSPVVPIFAPWDDKRQKFNVYIEPQIAIEASGNEDEDVRQLTARISGTIEQNIRRFPDQWLWIHKRWKTRPPGEPEIY